MRVVRTKACRLALAICVVSAVCVVFGLTPVAGGQAPPRRIAGFGSSVAFGTGDETGKEGYTGILRAMLAPRGWDVLNQSRGGDTTRLLATRWSPQGTPDPRTRYLTPVSPSYVIIALSLANEGIFEATSREEKDAVFNQYLDNLHGFVNRARQEHMAPILTLCYPRSVYTPVEYEYIRRANLLQNSWDVPTVNFLGALDDGTGRWARGFMFNDKHPNAAGHQELALTFAPTLFDALEQGKPTPSRPASSGFVRAADGDAPFTFTPESTMHPFAVGMMVRAAGDGTVVAVQGDTLEATIQQKQSGEGAGAVRFEEAALRVAKPFAAAVVVQNGTWTYRSADGTRVVSRTSADANWHQIVLSHYTARGETLFYVDGVLAGRVPERLQPKTFVFGGAGTGTPSAPKQADYKDVMIFRSALNQDEVAAIQHGQLLQASLELYAPLADATFRTGALAENRAQSLSGLKIGPGRLSHVDR